MPSEELLLARKAEMAGEIEKIEENMLATLRRRRRLIKRLGKWEELQDGRGDVPDEFFVSFIFRSNLLLTTIHQPSLSFILPTQLRCTP